MYMFVVYLFCFVHAFHVSVCDMVWNEETASLQIIQSVFADDLEAAIKKTYQVQSVDLFNGDAKAESEEWIQRYVRDNFHIAINNEKHALQWIGYEIVENTLRYYIEVEGVQKGDVVVIESRLLTDLFKDQENIVHCKVRKKTESIKLNGRNTKWKQII